MALDQIYTFSERLASGEAPADLLPGFSGVESLTTSNDYESQHESLRALNAVMVYLKDKNPNQSIGHFFPLQIGLKEYSHAQELSQDIQLLGKKVEAITLAEGPRPVGEVVGGVMASVVAAMKARGNWTPGNQAVFDDYLAQRPSSEHPLN